MVATVPSQPQQTAPNLPEKRQKKSAFDSALVKQASIDAFKKLNPKALLGNPVMLIVEIGAAMTTFVLIKRLLEDSGEPIWFLGWLTAWLWFTVLFANAAEALAEGRGKAQADALRKTRTETSAKVISTGHTWTAQPGSALVPGTLVLVEAGDIIPSDGDVVEGLAYVSEAAITGESAPVLKEPGTDTSSSVTGGTQVVSDWLVVKITAEPGKTFLDRMIALVEGASRQKTPNEIALTILLSGMTIIFLVVVMTLKPIADYAGVNLSTPVLIALLVTLIPTTIGALLSAIGIAGMDRLVQRNVLAMSGRAVEAAGDVDVLLLDKTGTITYGNRMAAAFLPLTGVSEHDLTEAALRASLADETPEGKSIVTLAKERGISANLPDNAEPIPFTAETRISGVSVHGRETVKGAVDAIAPRVPPTLMPELREISNSIALEGGTPLAVVDGDRALGIIYLKDTVKPGMAMRFAELRAMGIKTVMVTGDNPLTAKTIAHEAGVDDFVAEAKPEDKLRL
ncbi:MAG: potassium-transporting ATPase subunit KdpB, partial [Thermomicrobiales bacterium]